MHVKSLHCFLQTVSSSLLNNTFCIETKSSQDLSSSEIIDKQDTKLISSKVLSGKENSLRHTRNSRTKLLDLTDVNSSNEFDKPGVLQEKQGKRSGDMVFKQDSCEDNEAISNKRKRKMLNSNVSYFGPLS